jgi:DNA-binding NtrC family response regulator
MVNEKLTITLEVPMTIEAAQRKLVLATLDATRGNKVKAAESLGVCLKTMYNLLERYSRAA